MARTKRIFQNGQTAKDSFTRSLGGTVDWQFLQSTRNQRSVNPSNGTISQKCRDGKRRSQPSAAREPLGALQTGTLPGAERSGVSPGRGRDGGDPRAGGRGGRGSKMGREEGGGGIGSKMERELGGRRWDLHG